MHKSLLFSFLLRRYQSSSLGAGQERQSGSQKVKRALTHVCMCVCDVVVMLLKTTWAGLKLAPSATDSPLRDGGTLGARSPDSHTYFCLRLACIGLLLSTLALFFISQRIFIAVHYMDSVVSSPLGLF